MNQPKTSPLIPLGIGISVGAIGLWAIAQFFPYLLLAGAGYLAIKGLENRSKEYNGPTME